LCDKFKILAKAQENFTFTTVFLSDLLPVLPTANCTTLKFAFLEGKMLAYQPKAF